MKILILNILIKKSLKTSFDKRTKNIFDELKINYDTLYIDDLNLFSHYDTYSHLLISGSERSVMDEHYWYQPLTEIILDFKNHNKSILGICFGHQFLVRVLSGMNYLRKSPYPETGWTNIEIDNNSLFKGLKNFKSAVFHGDEVFNLNSDYYIIASSKRCGIHGFQYKGAPIWGIQFHPDFIYEDTFDFVDELRKTEENFQEAFVDIKISADEFRENDKIFENWVNVISLHK